MLYDQDMPKFLWAEACSTVVYIQNRDPHRALGNITPEEVFSQKKPEVSHFIILGSVAFYHVPNEKCIKLDQTEEKWFFMGYSETLKAYMIYIPSSRKIIMRQDVKFMEHGAFRRSYKIQSR